MHRPYTVETIPPLENGDHLSRAEFERRYDAMPHLKKAELIEGVVYMGSPLRYRSHGKPTRLISTWMGAYEAATPGVEGADNATVRLDLDNEPQPDNLLLISEGCGGQVTIDEDDYISGAPELAAETAASSVSYDLHVKFHVYRRQGVQEYIVWRTRDRAIDWFVLREGNYVRLQPDEQGVFRSLVFPGLWLDAAALMEMDLARVLAVLQQGLKTPEHSAFVAQLQAARKS